MSGVEKIRETKETTIRLTLQLDGGAVEIKSGIGFFDHMLTALAVHAGWGLTLEAEGDLWVDGHHTVEDVGIVLGQAFYEAVNRQGIQRYGHAYIPMDEALCRAVVDVSGRPFLVYKSEIAVPMIGDYDTQLTEEFFRAFAMNAGVTLHIEVLYGKNAHHMVEGIFKAVAHAFKMALMPRAEGVLSTKGVIE